MSGRLGVVRGIPELVPTGDGITDGEAQDVVKRSAKQTPAHPRIHLELPTPVLGQAWKIIRQVILHLQVGSPRVKECSFGAEMPCSSEQQSFFQSRACEHTRRVAARYLHLTSVAFFATLQQVVRQLVKLDVNTPNKERVRCQHG
jgi:hypothetical protein